MDKIQESLQTLTKEIAEIKDKCSNVNQELMGTGKNLGDDDDNDKDQSAGLVEKITLRGMLERISFQLDKLSASPILGENAASHSNKSNCKLDFGTTMPTGMPIRALTDDVEQNLLEEEVAAIVEKIPKVEELATSDFEEYQEHVGENDIDYFVALSIGNYLQADLNDLDYYFAGRYALELEPVISSETASLSTISYSSHIVGTISYKIAGTQLRLVVSFNQNSNYLAAAFVPDWHPMFCNTIKFENASIWKCMTDKRWCNFTKDPVSLTIRHLSILASVVCAAVADDQTFIKVIVVKKPEIVVLDRSWSLSKFKPMSATELVDGRTLRGKTVSSSLQTLDMYGYVLELSNYLCVSLSEIRVYFESYENEELLPTAAVYKANSIPPTSGWKTERVVRKEEIPRVERNMPCIPSPELNNFRSYPEVLVASNPIKATSRLSNSTYDTSEVHLDDWRREEFSFSSPSICSPPVPPIQLKPVHQEPTVKAPISAPKSRSTEIFKTIKNALVQPDLVTPHGRDVIIIKADGSGSGNGGLVTFRIGKTDLRLAVAFQLLNSGNKFSVAFVPRSTDTDANLMLFMMSDNQWNTCMDHQYSRAKDVEAVIETRNIRACVSMTDDIKALIKVCIKTF